MALPQFTMRQLLEAGVHFGHQSHRWNPKMRDYIFGVRNGIHIVDLSKSVPLLHQALLAVRNTVAGGGRVLFVGTKRQATQPIAEAAQRCAQYYINHRWLGGTLTNWKTILNSIKRLREVEEILSGDAQGYTKKEQLQLTRERDKLELSLGGIKEMGGVPNLLFVIDTNKEAIAIKEANKLGIPVVAVVDTNCDPDGITYPIPGNDDAARAISLYCDLVSRAVIDGISESQGAAGIDIGEASELQEDTLAEADAAAEEAPAESPEASADEAAGEGKETDSAAEVEVETKPAETKKAAPKKAAAKKTASKKAAAKKADAAEPETGAPATEAAADEAPAEEAEKESTA